jgi:glycosyltransferase involved in cell wall biosynthesis
MKRQPLVSIIVTTHNNHATLDACLASIVWQDYPNKELIIVDNNSTDDTKAIAQCYTPMVFNKGPERSAQRNYAVEQAKGEYVVIIDSDMELDSGVISACVAKVQEQPGLGSIIIPEESFGEGFWARCKQLERSFYVGVGWIEAARFFRKDLYQKAGGYDGQLVSGEDWDLSARIAALAPIGRIDEFIRHNEGRLSLIKTLQKKYYYAGLAGAYLQKNEVGSKLTAQVGPLQRYKLFFSKPVHLFRKPVVGIGMLFMKTCEFGFGGVGYLAAKRRTARNAEATQ